MHLAIIGATGLVGRKILETLDNFNFDITELSLVASSRSEGLDIVYKGKVYKVKALDTFSFEGVDYALFAAGGTTSKDYIPKAKAAGAIVIDNSSFYRMDEKVPLVVPEVNLGSLFKHEQIIANPNCSTIQLVVALKKINDLYKLKRIICSTYQAVSGARQIAMEQLINEEKGLDFEKVLPYKGCKNKQEILHNVIPQIDVFLDNDYTKEEMKMVNEIKKIMNINIPISTTCVRIPVLNGHSESVYFELEEEVSIETLKEVLQESEGVILIDDPKLELYPTPINISGSPYVYVGRLRKDLDIKNGYHCWIVADNLLKGAAYNAVQILDCLVHKEIND